MQIKPYIKGKRDHFWVLYPEPSSEIIQAKRDIYRYFRLLFEEYNTSYISRQSQPQQYYIPRKVKSCMSQNSLINSIIGWGSTSGSSLERKISKFDRYLTAPLVKDSPIVGQKMIFIF